MIITLTVNPALDLYSTLDVLEPNEKLRCTKPTLDPGGGGVNVSRVIKRLGGDSTAIYTRGGYSGEKYDSLLEQEQVKQDAVKVKNDMRENFAVTETSSGELYRFGFPGAALEDSEFEEIFQRIDQYAKADYLVASGSLPPDAPSDFYARVAAKAKKHNIKFILDTSGKAYSGVLEEGAYLLKPNINELQDLLGKKAADEEQQKKLLLEVINDYPVEVVVLSLGPRGAFLATKGEVRHYPAPSVEHISSIGAGDSMVAGIVHCLSQGNSIEKAILFGLACGSATIKSPGTELLEKEDVQFLYEQLQKNTSEEGKKI